MQRVVYRSVVGPKVFMAMVLDLVADEVQAGTVGSEHTGACDGRLWAWLKARRLGMVVDACTGCDSGSKAWYNERWRSCSSLKARRLDMRAGACT